MTTNTTTTAPQRRFLLAGVALAVLGIAVLLWAGSFRGAFTHFAPNLHETCGQPVSLRAEGYNLLGGTRYGTGPGDLGDDVDLSHIDICDPVVQIMADGEERLWFWLDVETVGRTFPYYAWGVPERDIENLNANDWRDPVDPLWDTNAIAVIRYATADGHWATGRGELCPANPQDMPPINMFIDSGSPFRIPQNGRRAAWVCARMGAGERLPDGLVITFRPQLARLTRWVDKTFDISEETPVTETPFGPQTRRYLLPILNTHPEICQHALVTHPESVPLGMCPAS